MTVALAPQYTQRTYVWSAWKVVQQAKVGIVQFDDDGQRYTIWFYDGPEVHICTIWRGALPDGILGGGYTQEQNDADKAEFEAGYKPGANKALVQRTADGRVISASGKPDGSRANFFSFNWCDKTTWYEQATYVVDAVANDSGDQLTYSLAHAHIIDTYHAKISGEDFLLDANGHSFRVAVKVNGVVKTEQDPHPAAGGDYTVDYDLGKVTFLSARDPADVVTVTYHFANSSRFTIKPSPGKKLVVDIAEVQFSTDVIITDTVRYAAYGYVDAFAPQYLQANGGPYPSGTLIPLGNPFVYKGIQDFLNDSLRSYPTYAPIGGDGWRGMPIASTVFDWDYIRSLILSSAAGMEIRIYLEHDIPFGGTFATATLYCGSVPE